MSVTASRHTSAASGKRTPGRTPTASPAEAPAFFPTLHPSRGDGAGDGVPHLGALVGAAPAKVPVTVAPPPNSELYQVTTVEHQGTVIAFARNKATGAVYYDILDLKVSTEIDDAAWTGYNKLDLPAELRPLGLDLLTVPDQAGALLTPAPVPLKAVSDDAYVYVLQQSEAGSLLLNRCLLRRVAPEGGGMPVPVLEPAWEVRYQRSGKQDIPDSPKDSQGYNTPGGDPFLEPTLELPIRGLSDGRFAAQLLPTQLAGVRRWQFFAVDTETGKLDCFSFPCDGTGLPDLSAAITESDGAVRADMSLTLRESGSGSDLAPAGAPTAAVFTLRERAQATGGDDLLLKRATRDLVALPVVTAAGERRFATLDFALAVDGSLSVLPELVDVTDVQPANWGLNFAPGTYLTLRNSENRLSISGGFRIRLWMCPGSQVDSDQFLVSGDDRTSPKAAPYLELTRDLRIAFGYGDGTALVEARTDRPVAKPALWTKVEVSYDPAETGQPFRIRINDKDVKTTVTPGGSPSGAPVTTICGDKDDGRTKGFVGVLDEITFEQPAETGWACLASWPLDEVDYDRTPPVTPDTFNLTNPNDAEVFGATQVPSSAPIPDRDSQGKLYVDARGLSSYAGLLAFARPTGSGSLLTGAAGLVHLYFAGPAPDGRPDDVLFSVAQYDALSARAVFEAQWLAGKEPAPESGTVTFTAARSGTFMNEAQIRIGASSTPGLCTITLNDEERRRETWKGVPRAADALVDVLNGVSTSDLADPALVAGTRVFYDNAGSYAIARLRAVSHATDADFLLLSRHPEMLQVAEAEVGPTQDAFADLTVRYTVPGWDEPVTHTWPEVPRQVSALTSVLAGTSPSYPYDGASIDGNDTLVHSIATVGATGRPGHLLLLTQPETEALKIAIQGNQHDSCTVIVQFGDEQPVAWDGIPRGQQDVADLLNSNEVTASRVRAITTGLTATVVNRDLAEPQREGLRAWTGILVGFPAEPMAPNAELRPDQRSTAAVDQKSTVVGADGTEQPLEGPSTLFRALAATRPTNGSAALVQDTPAAHLAVQATGGGWTRVTPHKAISLNGANYVRFDQAADAASDVLALRGDITVEAWCRPAAPGPGPLVRPRIATYQRPAEDPEDQAIQWTLGLSPLPCLAFGPTTRVVQGQIDLPQYSDATVQLTLSPTHATGSGEVLGLNLQEGLGERKYLHVATDGQRHILVTYLGQNPPLRSRTSLDTGVFHQVTVVLRNHGRTHNSPVDLELYVNGKLDASMGSRSQSMSKHPGLLRVGDPNRCLTMRANGAQLWRRALTGREIEDTYRQGTDLSDRDLLISWAMTEGGGARYVINAAASHAGFATEIRPVDKPVTWDTNGALRRPWAANRSLSLVAAQPVLHDWHHLAACYSSGYAVALDGTQYADCGNATTLDASAPFSVEACFTPRRNPDGRNAQVLVSKPGNYELRIAPDGTLALRVWLDSAADPLEVTTAGKGDNPGYRTRAGVPCYVAAVMATGSVPPPTPTDHKIPPKPTYYAELLLYVDGVQRGRHYQKGPDPVYVQSAATHLTLGRGAERDPSFDGRLSDVRLWSVALEKGAIASTAAKRQPPSTDGLVSSWRWSEQSGKYGYDDNGLSTAVLTANNLWRVYPATARMALVVDGIEQTDAHEDWIPVNNETYGRQQFTMGAAFNVKGEVFATFKGDLCEVRVWNRTRTAEQIREDMYRMLAGDESGLAGYWPLNTGSGTAALDATGHGSTGTFASVNGSLPVWVSERAPLGNEAREVYNVLGGQVTRFTERITGTPSVAEYAETRYDAYRTLYSVMKRTYAADREGSARLVSGYTVGDLTMAYAGQVQTAPSVVGFVEGAAPLPSENNTNPYWADLPFAGSYADKSKTRVVQADSVTREFAGSEKNATTMSVKAGGGVVAEVDTEDAVGVCAGASEEVSWTVGTFKAKAGLNADATSELDGEKEARFGYRTSRTTVDEIASGGDWEDPQHVLNTDVGRRFIPDNNGYAVVKSLTADMYLLMLPGSNTVVSTTLVPDPDIPEDVNVITFPLAPGYIKNGTLDGMVGFTTDPDYPNADVQRGSYFKPIEAYALKRAAERQDKQLEAYYQQFDENRLSRAPHRTPQGATESGFTEFTERVIAGDPAYDWARSLSKRAIVNTYVWTAGGGLHTEQSEVVDTRSESFAGLSTTDGKLGAAGRMSFGSPVGPYVELDATFGTSVEVHSVRSRDSESGFALEVEFEPERYLRAPVLEGGQPVGFTAADAPGKVTGYRFMSMLIPQSAQNFEALMHQVIDENWLQNSPHPDAAALRTATSQSNGVWRVLHRTTYVSRVAPPLQHAPAASTAPAITEPAGLDGNALLMGLVRAQIPESELNPSPVQIGQAVQKVLGRPDERGLLSELLPWWDTFAEDAKKNPRSEEAAALTALRVDLLAYVIQYYAAESAKRGPVLAEGHATRGR